MCPDENKVAGRDEYETSGDEEASGSEHSSEDDSSSAGQGVYHPFPPEVDRGLFLNVGFTLVVGICIGIGCVILAWTVGNVSDSASAWKEVERGSERG